jgi:hypothetical protein
MLGFVAILISKSWGCHPPGLGMPFLNSDTCAEGVIYFCQGFLPLYDAIHGWMTGQMDGWMDGKLHEKRPRHPLLYVIGGEHPTRRCYIS